MPKLTVLDFLRRLLAGTLPDGAKTQFRYPTAISRTLGFRIVAVDHGTATVEMDADPEIHGNQQGTIHGGMLAELADAAIGTAHSTVVHEGDSFTGVDLRINFFRPVWKTVLRAAASPVHSGKTMTHYQVDITNDQGKLVARAQAVVMTLKGEKAHGR